MEGLEEDAGGDDSPATMQGRVVDREFCVADVMDESTGPEVARGHATDFRADEIPQLTAPGERWAQTSPTGSPCRSH